MIAFGHSLVLLYVFSVQSRLMELLLPGLRSQLVLAMAALLLALLSGTFMRAFTSRVGICLMLLTLWFAFGVPFSVHPYGALENILSPWLKNLALFIMVLSLASTRRHCAQLMMAMALGSTATAIASLLIGTDEQSQRLVLQDSSLNDPNTLGMMLLVGLLLWAAVIADRSRFLLSRAFAGLCTIPILVALPLTGSRGTLVGALIVGAYMFKRFSIGGKAGLVVICVLTVTLGGAFLADDLLSRFGTIADADHLSNVGSKESRVHLFVQGIRLIARNPITGVGLGRFAHAENALARSQGERKGAWHTCHNMFIQIASEAGLPAFLLYCMILMTVWKGLGRLESVTVHDHPQAAQVVRLAFWSRVALLAFCACGLFLSCALNPILLTLLAVPLALMRIVQSEVNQVARERGEAVDEPVAALEVGSLAAPVRGLRSEA